MHELESSIVSGNIEYQHVELAEPLWDVRTDLQDFQDSMPAERLSGYVHVAPLPFAAARGWPLIRESTEPALQTLHKIQELAPPGGDDNIDHSIEILADILNISHLQT